jgi:hypothetical protein
MGPDSAAATAMSGAAVRPATYITCALLGGSNTTKYVKHSIAASNAANAVVVNRVRAIAFGIVLIEQRIGSN